MKLKLKSLPLAFIFPVLIVMFLDLVFTMVGQSASYWAGDFSAAVEGSPARFLLTAHPLLFILPFIGYLFIVFFLLKKLPLKVGIFAAISLFLIHTWGSSSWIFTLSGKLAGYAFASSARWFLAITYLILLSGMASLFILKYLGKEK